MRMTRVVPVALAVIVLCCVLFVCKCVLCYCHRLATQLQLTNILSHHTVAISAFVMLGGSTSLGVALAVLAFVTMEVSGKRGGGEDGRGTWRRLNVILKDKNASLSSYARCPENTLNNTRPLNAQ
jgi:hypothetical protein